MNLKELSDDRRKRIDEAVARQECLDKLRLEFAKFASVSMRIYVCCVSDFDLLSLFNVICSTVYIHTCTCRTFGLCPWSCL